MSARVLIVGGGPGAVEAALALQALAGDRVAIELLVDDPVFHYRPWAVAEPFGMGTPVDIDLRRLADDRGFSLTRGSLLEVGDGQVHSTAGPIPFDQLVLALGARRVGAVAGAMTFGGPRDARALREALPRCGRVAFVATPSAFWPLPAYELALMTTTWAQRADRAIGVTLVTGETAPLEAFGGAASGEIADLLRSRRIDVHLEAVAESYDPGEGRLLLPGAGSIDADLAVALPALIGPAPAGLPHDELGFVPVDDTGRVDGHSSVYAVGDMTARPLKQGGLAAQQADVAAAAVARELGAVVERRRYEPVLRAMLLTGEGPRYLRNPPTPSVPSAGSEAIWWPPHKIAGAHLGPYLATHAELVEAHA